MGRYFRQKHEMATDMAKHVNTSSHVGSGDKRQRLYFVVSRMPMTNASSARFFQKVCQLVMMMASPKQPQSDTGLVSAIHSVSGV